MTKNFFYDIIFLWKKGYYMKKLQIKTSEFEIYSTDDNDYYAIDSNGIQYSEFFTETLFYNIMEDLYFNNIKPIYMSDEAIYNYNQMIKDEIFE